MSCRGLHPRHVFPEGGRGQEGMEVTTDVYLCTFKSQNHRGLSEFSYGHTCCLGVGCGRGFGESVALAWGKGAMTEAQISSF